MTSEQANALLTLIADLARIIYGQGPSPEPDPAANGTGTVKETVTAQ